VTHSSVSRGHMTNILKSERRSNLAGKSRPRPYGAFVAEFVFFIVYGVNEVVFAISVRLCHRLIACATMPSGLLRLTIAAAVSTVIGCCYNTCGEIPLLSRLTLPTLLICLFSIFVIAAAVAVLYFKVMPAILIRRDTFLTTKAHLFD
jgi:hypothetical protein